MGSGYLFNYSFVSNIFCCSNAKLWACRRNLSFSYQLINFNKVYVLKWSSEKLMCFFWKSF